MPLITSQGYQLTPNISPIAQQIGQALQQKQLQQRQGELRAKKERAIQIKQAAETAGAQALRVRGIKDFSSQRKEIAVLAQNAIKRGEDPQVFVDALNITNPDELNLHLTRVATRAADAGKLIDQGLKAERELEMPAGQREFEALTKDLPEEQKKEAALIKLGLSPRAVGSAIQTISEKNLAEEIGKTEAIIAQRKKFGEMTGSSRAKMIDKGFEKIVKIDLGISNLDKAIAAIDDGASTGFLQKFTPSIRASSVALEQVRNTLALDVLNSATFGALSEKELELVKKTAMPDLPPPELRVWLQERKIAEQKLKAYFQEQINFLDQGGTVAGFLRSKEREQETQPAAVQSQVIPSAAPQGGVKFLGFE